MYGIGSFVEFALTFHVGGFGGGDRGFGGGDNGFAGDRGFNRGGGSFGGSERGGYRLDLSAHFSFWPLGTGAGVPGPHSFHFTFFSHFSCISSFCARIKAVSGVLLLTEFSP